MGRLLKGKSSQNSNKNNANGKFSVGDFHGETAEDMPAIPEFLTYCCQRCGHVQKLKAEELNTIVGNAFKMAYAAQLQKQPTFQDVISQQQQSQVDKVLWTKEFSNAFNREMSRQNQNQNPNPNQNTSAVITTSTSTSGHAMLGIPTLDAADLRSNAPPTSIPGLRTYHTSQKYNVSERNAGGCSTQSTPNSEESNSPTELNSYKKMLEKPPLIKRLAMGLTGTLNNVLDDDNCPLVSVSDNNSNSSTPGSPTNRALNAGYVNGTNATTRVENLKNDNKENSNSNNKNFEMLVMEDCRLLQSSPSFEHDYKKTRRFFMNRSSTSSSSTENGGCALFVPAPSPPERTDSLNNREQEELKMAPWFQAGIPREIALEILGQEPIGAFMVRESTSKPGCFALSLRVPRNFQPTGIAHYLIVRINKGYKIQGFTKEFSTLTSLITHHSVMPELLPCPLSLSRYNPSSFVRKQDKKDFADIDLEPDYNTLADFRKMMADLNV